MRFIAEWSILKKNSVKKYSVRKIQQPVLEAYMFIGRKKELTELHQELNSSHKTSIMIYGKRRIGKSTLIQEASRDYEGTVINHLCVRSSYQGNLDLLSRSIALTMHLPEIHFSQISDVFSLLGSMPKNILLVLDEYQYLKQSLREGEMDSLMQGVIDRLPSNVRLILCGSYITVMKELLKEDNPLFGRFSLIIHLEEMDYLDAAGFALHAQNRDKISRYAVFGGSPYVQSVLKPESRVRDDIIRLLIPSTGILRTYIENVMLKEIQKAYDIRIFEAIGNGKKKYSELSARLENGSSGLLDKQLKNLMDMEAIRKVAPINRRTDRRKQFYEISDNLIRFYFTYIFGNTAAISNLGEEAYFDAYIAPSIQEFISRRFENIAIQYFRRKARSGEMTGVLDFGSLWYDDPENRRNGEFDCVLRRQDGFDFYKCRYYQDPMTEAECRKEARQIYEVPGAVVRKIGFICSAGFDFESDEYDLISGDKLYDSAELHPV